MADESFRLAPQQLAPWKNASGPRPDALWSQVGVEIDAPHVDADAIAHALARLVARHEALRTVYAVSSAGRGAVGTVLASAPVAWREVDDGSDPAAIARAECAAFDPGRLPIVRAALVHAPRGRYTLVITLPALAADERTLNLLVRELAAEVAGEPHASDVAPYAQFATWQNERADETGDAPDAARAHWRALGDATALALALPADRDDGPDARTSPLAPDATGPVDLDASTVRALARVAADCGAQLADALFACWEATLWRHTGRATFVIGRASDGRVFEELEGIHGLLARTLPIACALDERDVPRFDERVRAAGEAARRAEARADWYEARDGTPVAPDAQFVYEPCAVANPQGVRWRTLGLYAHAARFRVKLACRPGGEGDGLALQLQYDAATVDAEGAARLLDGVATLARAAAVAPRSRVDQLEVLGPAERQKLDAWQPRGPRGPRPARRVHRLFEAQVARSPDAIAVSDAREVLRFGELDRRANRLANHLRRRGAGPGTCVALAVERSAEMAVAILGVLKTGAAYVPLDPAYPADRLAVMLDDARPVLIAVRGEGAATALALLRTDVPHVDLHEVRDTIARESSAAPADDCEAPAQLAYLMYTSGSTGRPRGVGITHASLHDYVHALGAALQVTPDDAWVHTASMSFSSSVRQLLLPLVHGASVVVADRDQMHDPLALFALVGQRRGTVLDLVPSTWRAATQALATLDAAARARALDVPLRMIVSASEPLGPDLVRAWRSLCPRAIRLVNMYGQTETTGIVAVQPVGDPSAADDHAGFVRLGRALPHAGHHVLDRRGRPVPLGAVGTLHIGGTALARGYFDRPGATAARFVPDPFATEPGARLYDTGDQVRWRPDGSLEFVGRRDDQAKVRGMRVELGEVDAVLRRHPAVHDCALVFRDDAPGGRQLVAYVVAAAPVPSPLELRTHALARLPGYMVPAMIVLLPSLPRLPSGKVDRASLPRPDETTQTAGFVAPRTPLEARLAVLWAEALRVARVGVRDDFFALGGQSIIGTVLTHRISHEFGIRLPATTLFDAPTIERLAVRIEHARTDATPRDALDVQAVSRIVPSPDERYEPFPLTDVQQAYWIGRSEGLEVGNVATTTYQEVDFAQLDLARFEQVINRLIERHDMLRAVVMPDGRQRVLPTVPHYAIVQTDLRGRSQAERDAQLAALRQESSRQVRAVDRWPVFDIRAVVLDDSTRLCFTLDYVQFDGWSVGLLFREIVRRYDDLDAALPPLEITFRDYVISEAAGHGSPAYERARTYWLDRAPTLPLAPELPLAPHAPARSRPEFARFAAHIDAARWTRLCDRARDAGITPSVLLCTAYAMVLAAWSRRAAFTLNITTFNRPPVHPQINQILGDFTTLSLLEVDLTHDAAFDARARALQTRLWNDLDHRQFSGVSVIRELVRAGRVKAGDAAMPVVFTSTLALAAVDADEQPADPASQWVAGSVGYSIGQSAQVWIDNKSHRAPDGGLACIWDAVPTVFAPGVVDAMFAAYLALLDRLAADDDRIWRALRHDLLPAADLAPRLAANATDAPVPAGLLHEPFFARVELQPDAPAVIAPDRTLSYADLARRARDVAARLGRAGAGRDEALVAVVMKPGWEHIVAVLGVLEAGATYLPIDPSLPRPRLHELLERGGVRLALTQPSLEASLELPDGVTRLVVDDAPCTVPVEPSSAPRRRADDLAYVIFTSGSTGVPKGVMIEHGAALNTVVDINRRHSVGPRDRVLALSSLWFDLSVQDVFGTLAAGGAIVLPHADAARDPAEWAARVEDAGVTIWNSVPALMGLYVDHLEGHRDAVADTLRLVLLSGDWIPVALPARVRARMPEARVVSLGGATEASIWSIAYPIDRVESGWTSIPYGRPMANQRFHVLNARLDPSPTGAVGELYIAGVGLARGYWRDTERTDAAFIVHPRTGERMYRTGDLGRYLPDGTIEFLGREDFQVKVQGYRVELGEIESVLEQHPDVRTAVAVATGAAGGDRRLIAYVVAADPVRGVPDPTALQDHARSRLPAYMVPVAIGVLSSLPLSANGKVDRAALPSLETTAASGSGSQQPGTPLEARIVAVAVRALGREAIGVDDDLIARGANSIDLVRLVNVLEVEFGVRIPLRTVFDAPTCRAIAVFYAAQQTDDVEVGEI